MIFCLTCSIASGFAKLIVFTECNIKFKFKFSKGPRPALGPTQPPTQCVLRVKQRMCETHHSPPSSAQVRNK